MHGKVLAETAKQALGPIIPSAGPIAGSLIGAKTALPFAPAAGPWAPAVVAGGALIGGAGGEGIQQVGEHIVDWLRGRQTAPQTSEEAMRRINEQAALGGAGELGGQAIGKVVEKTVAPYAHRMTQAGFDFLQFLKDVAARTGEKVTPAIQDVRNAPVMSRLAATARKMIGGGPIEEGARTEIRAVRGEPATGQPGFAELRAGELAGTRPGTQTGVGQDIKTALEGVEARTEQARGIRTKRIMDQAGLTPGVPTANRGETLIAEGKAVHQRNVDAVNAAKEAFLTSTGATRETTAVRGRETHNALRGLADQLSDEGGYMYEQAGHLDPGIPTVKIDKAAKKAKEIAGQIKQADIALAKTGTVPPATELEGTRKLVEAIADMEGEIIPFAAAEGLGQKLQALVDRHPALAAVRGALKADQATLKVTNPAHQPLVEAYEEARRFWREGPAQFKPDKPLGALIKESKEPVAVMDKLLAEKDASIGLLESVKKQVGEQGEIWRNLRAELLQRMADNPKYAARVGPQTKALLLRSGEEQSISQLHAMSEKAQTTQAARLAQTAEGTRAIESTLLPQDRSIAALEEIKRVSGTTGAWKDITAEAMERSLADQAYYAGLGPRTKAAVFTPAQQATIERIHALPPPIADNVRRYLKMDAGNIVKEVLGAGERNVESITALKDIIGRTPAWKAMRSEALHSLANDPAALTRMSDAKLAVLFDSPEQRELLKSVSSWYQRSTAGMRLQRGEFERPTGTLVAPGMQIAGASALGLSILEATGTTSLTSDRPWLRRAAYAGTVLLAPNVFARLATRPGVVKWMTTGGKTPAGTPEAARVLAQILPRYNAEAKKMGEPPLPMPPTRIGGVAGAGSPRVPEKIQQAIGGTGGGSRPSAQPTAPMTSRPAVPAPIQRAVGARR